MNISDLHQLCCQLACCKFCRAIVQRSAADRYMLTLHVQQHHNTVRFTHASNSFVDCGRLLRLVQTVSVVPKYYCLEQASATQKRKEKTTPFGVNLMRSQILYRAAQASATHILCSLYRS